MIAILVMALLGALLWRLRGGLLNALTGQANWRGFNDTAVRLIWSACMAVAFLLCHPGAAWLGSSILAPLWAGHGIYGFLAWMLFRHLILGLALFAGTTIGWFGAALLPAKWHDVGLLSLSGILRMAPVALVLLSPWPLLAGVLFGPAYWLGARIPQKPSGWDFWGEWITGAVIGACLGAM